MYTLRASESCERNSSFEYRTCADWIWKTTAENPTSATSAWQSCATLPMRRYHGAAGTLAAAVTVIALEPAFFDDDGITRLERIVQRHLAAELLAAGSARQFDRAPAGARRETAGDRDRCF